MWAKAARQAGDTGLVPKRMRRYHAQAAGGDSGEQLQRARVRVQNRLFNREAVWCKGGSVVQGERDLGLESSLGSA